MVDIKVGMVYVVVCCVPIIDHGVNQCNNVEKLENFMMAVH